MEADTVRTRPEAVEGRVKPALGTVDAEYLSAFRHEPAGHRQTDAALFLASDESRYVNGQALNVCGGLSAAFPAPTIITDSL